MSASPPAPLIWDARLYRWVPEGMVGMRGCIDGCRSPSATMALPSPQEPAGKRNGPSAANGIPPPPRNAVEAAAAASRAAAGELVSEPLNPVSAEPARALGPRARRACERVCPDCYPITLSEITLSALRTGTELPAMTNNEPVQMITRIPADLRDRIKAHAALERMSMNELVARVMDAAVLRDLESVRQAAAIK
jgi:hypothetical protein